MIFSFSNASGTVEFTLDHTDIFCFFNPPRAVTIPGESWLIAVCASLRLKKHVLIMETSSAIIPEIKFNQRWTVGEDFLWLAPRALSTLLEAPAATSSSYQALKIHLQSFK